MIIKEEFLSRLRKIFDLNLYEAKVWTALLSRGVSTAGELSSISDVPRSRTYDILESLEKKGFIVMKIGKPIKFVEPSDLSGSLRGRQNMYNHMDMMIRSAEKTITLVTTTDGLNRKLEALLPAFEKARKRGVTIRIAAPLTADNYKIAKEMSRFAEVRNLSGFQGRFAIIDSEQVMFMLLDDKSVHPSYDVAVWLSTEFFAKSLEQMFELAWSQFTPLNKIRI